MDIDIGTFASQLTLMTAARTLTLA